MIETPPQLIISAFEQARRSGKADWRRMTVAVLKNRLLSLTRGEFNESNYGVHTMRDFANLARDIVSIDSTTDPPIVALLSEAEQDAERPVTKSQVRPDLWHAILDYSSGATFVWDPNTQRAREALPTDDLPVLPTISESDMRSWRASFADQNALLALDDAAREKLHLWQERILSSKVLPKPLAGTWLSELKGKVVDRLRSWFAEHSIEEPPNLLQSFAPSRAYAVSAQPNIAALRKIVIECVEVMSERELSELLLSPAVLLRATQGKTRVH